MASVVHRGVKIVRGVKFDWALGGPLLGLLTLGLSAGVFVGQRELFETRGPHSLPVAGNSLAPIPSPPILGRTTPFHWLK